MNTQPVSGGRSIKIAGLSLVFESFGVRSNAITGREVAEIAAVSSNDFATVLEILSSGELEDIRPDEVVDLNVSIGKFVVAESDRSYKFALNDTRYEWPCRLISGGQIRKIGGVASDEDIYLDLPGKNDHLIENHELVDLDDKGIELLKSRKKVFKLNVQGVVIEVNGPTIRAREAISQAGFDPEKNWIIVLRVQGQPKQTIGIDDVVDLRTPGIEKLRLTPKEVNNGDAQVEPRRMFPLLEIDEAYLNASHFVWETVIDARRRWLLIHDYPIPEGYSAERTLLALEIPDLYPGAQIDMFYTTPKLALKSGRAIDRTQVEATILGYNFNGWSRHRGALSKWDPAKDNVATHLALVESAIGKEVGE
jgi:Prokaryotic E2 family E/Multiubiquitin